jgi:glyoxylate carboligase
MDAPLYPPASVFEQPRSLPQLLSTRTSSIAELKADPEAMEILKVALPSMSSEQVGPEIAILIEAISIRSAVAMGGVKQEDVDKIEAQFVLINKRRGLLP